VITACPVTWSTVSKSPWSMRRWTRSFRPSMQYDLHVLETFVTHSYSEATWNDASKHVFLAMCLADSPALPECFYDVLK